MMTILCYGDSNTWGADPVTGERLAPDVRWPGVLRAALGAGFHVIEEGLCGRTTVWDDPIEEYKNGKTYLYPCLESHKPIDMVIIFLGTNDLKYRFHLGAFDIAESAGLLCDIVRESACGPDGATPRVLALCPCPIAETGAFTEMFRGGREISLGLHAEFARMGKERGITVLYPDAVTQSSPVDGIHFSPESHAAIGALVAAKAREPAE
jgi:lysophospholipase L1-like esterase